MLNAIFHQDAYFLLPDAFATFEAFLADVQARELPATYQMIPLLEDNKQRNWTVIKGICMAPYFLTGYRDEPVAVTISNPDDVYPVQVERMTQEEYNDRLRCVIEGYCDGCLGYKQLTPKVQSLNGHHEEISLNGVCFFRYETKPSPRILRPNMMWLGGGFMRYQYAQKDAEEMRQNIKEHTYIVYDSASKDALPDGSQLLTVTAKKKELLPPYLALALGHYIDNLTGSYRIAPSPLPEVTPEAILALAAPDKREAFRKECKKYGVSIADLTWDGQDQGRVLSSLQALNKQSILYVLWEAADRAILLLMDTPNAMKELRYRAPMLEHHGAVITVHGQYHSRRYTVNFDMPFTELD